MSESRRGGEGEVGKGEMRSRHSSMRERGGESGSCRVTCDTGLSCGMQHYTVGPGANWSSQLSRHCVHI